MKETPGKIISSSRQVAMQVGTNIWCKLSVFALLNFLEASKMHKASTLDCTSNKQNKTHLF